MDLAGSDSRLLLCPGQPMMAEIWSAYNSYARARLISIGNGDSHSQTASKEVVVAVTGLGSV